MRGSFRVRVGAGSLRRRLRGGNRAGKAAGTAIALEAGEIGAQFGGVLIAHAAIFFERFGDGFFEARRNIGIQAHGGDRRFFEDGVEDYGGGIAAEGNRAGGHFVEDRAKAEKIAAHVESFAAGLLGRHVSDGADGGAGAGEIGFADGGTIESGGGGAGGAGFVAGGENLLGEAEIENFGVAAIGDEKIGGLDVAMDDAFGMRGVEGVGDFDAEIEQRFHIEGASGNAVLERHAIEKFHDDEGASLVLADFVDGADIGMIEGGSSAGFAAETFESLRIADEIFGKKF